MLILTKMSRRYSNSGAEDFIEPLECVYVFVCVCCIPAIRFKWVILIRLRRFLSMAHLLLFQLLINLNCIKYHWEDVFFFNIWIWQNFDNLMLNSWECHCYSHSDRLNLWVTLFHFCVFSYLVYTDWPNKSGSYSSCSQSSLKKFWKIVVDDRLYADLTLLFLQISWRIFL
jgi:hypothetical protein